MITFPWFLLRFAARPQSAVRPSRIPIPIYYNHPELWRSWSETCLYGNQEAVASSDEDESDQIDEETPPIDDPPPPQKGSNRRPASAKAVVTRPSSAHTCRRRERPRSAIPIAVGCCSY